MSAGPFRLAPPRLHDAVADAVAPTVLDEVEPGPWMPLPFDRSASASARRYLEQGGAELPTAVLADALLATSELVTNALLHGEPDLTFRVGNASGVVYVQVRNGSGRSFPATLPGRAPVLQPHGRELLIVNAVATEWGVHHDDGGTTVWFGLRFAAEDDVRCG